MVRLGKAHITDHRVADRAYLIINVLATFKTAKTLQSFVSES
jgi:hypothetical protein